VKFTKKNIGEGLHLWKHDSQSHMPADELVPTNLKASSFSKVELRQNTFERTGSSRSQIDLTQAMMPKNDVQVA